ncbi:Hypothetical protein HDN1F_31520 [gamma proteobacterium HdN1]|nr:Hypothetical protein HDN1F_31520 [gamma proteobacterium HdN1]
MKLEYLLALQAGIFATIIIVFSLFYAARLKKNLKKLQALFDTLKADITGTSLISGLESALEQTNTYSPGNNATFTPEQEPPLQANALRRTALEAEIASLVSSQGKSTNSQSAYNAALTPYLLIAEQIARYAEELRQSIKDQLTAEFQHRIVELERQLDAINRRYKALDGLQQKIKPLVDLLQTETPPGYSQKKAEQSLYKALVSSGEAFNEAAAVREVIYVYHEAYLEHVERENRTHIAESAGNPAPPEISEPTALTPETPKLSLAHFDPSPHMATLNHIIDEQTQLITELQQQLIAQGGELDERLRKQAKTLDSNTREAKTCLDMLDLELAKLHETAPAERTPSAPNNEEEQAEVGRLIEQFSEDSAALLERSQLLHQRNKLLLAENERLKQQLGTDALTANL